MLEILRSINFASSIIILVLFVIAGLATACIFGLFANYYGVFKKDKRHYRIKSDVRVLHILLLIIYIIMSLPILVILIDHIGISDGAVIEANKPLANLIGSGICLSLYALILLCIIALSFKIGNIVRYSYEKKKGFKPNIVDEPEDF